MPTNRIGTGTVNFAVNLLKQEHSALGKLAFKKGVSMGQLAVEALHAFFAKEAPRDAETLARLRVERRRWACAAACVVAFFFVFVQSLQPEDDKSQFMRARRGTRQMARVVRARVSRAEDALS